MDENKIFELLEKSDWNTIGHNLILFSVRLAKKYRWKTGDALILPGGKTPEDIAYEAIEKVFNKKRDWNPDKYPDLLKHLQYIVKSDMGHLFNSELHNKMSKMPDAEIPQPDDTDIHSLISIQKNPEDHLILKEKMDMENHLKEKLYDEVSGDNDLETLLLLIDDGIGKPEEIAKEMGKGVSEINNLRKKLIRKGKKVFNLLNKLN